MFEPLPIGGITPPVQNYYLFNGGGQTLQFELELDALDDVQKVTLCVVLLAADDRLIISLQKMA